MTNILWVQEVLIQYDLHRATNLQVFAVFLQYDTDLIFPGSIDSASYWFHTDIILQVKYHTAELQGKHIIQTYTDADMQ